MNEKVIDVPAEPYKTGFSEKTKKDWSIYKVVTESGKTASVFAPVKVGDILDLTNDEKYGWQGKVQRERAPVTVDFEPVMEALRKIYEKIDGLEKTFNKEIARVESLLREVKK